MIKQNVIQNPLRTATSSFFGYQQHYLRKKTAESTSKPTTFESPVSHSLSTPQKSSPRGSCLDAFRLTSLSAKKTQQCQALKWSVLGHNGKCRNSELGVPGFQTLHPHNPTGAALVCRDGNLDQPELPLQSPKKIEGYTTTTWYS